MLRLTPADSLFETYAQNEAAQDAVAAAAHHLKLPVPSLDDLRDAMLNAVDANHYNNNLRRFDDEFTKDARAILHPVIDGPLLPTLNAVANRGVLSKAVFGEAFQGNELPTVDQDGFLGWRMLGIGFDDRLNSTLRGFNVKAENRGPLKPVDAQAVLFDFATRYRSGEAKIGDNCRFAVYPPSDGNMAFQDPIGMGRAYVSPNLFRLGSHVSFHHEPKGAPRVYSTASLPVAATLFTTNAY